MQGHWKEFGCSSRFKNCLPLHYIFRAVKTLKGSVFVGLNMYIECAVMQKASLLEILH